MEKELARKRVGQEVQKRRNRAGLDQAALSGSAGVDAKTVRSLERGERWPRETSRTKIEKALQWPKGTLALMLAEAEELADPDGDLESASLIDYSVPPSGKLEYLVQHPSRTDLVPDGAVVPLPRILELVDAARLVYMALDDIANGDSLEVLPRQAARLHSAATRVAYEWAGGKENFDRVALTLPGIADEISRSPDSAMRLVQKIRDRG